MGALTSAEREFLVQQYRWVETRDEPALARHRNAREAEFSAFFVTLAGATAAVLAISAATAGDKRMVVATVDRALDLSFKGKPPTVRVFTSRFGFTLAAARDMVCERATIDRGNRRSTLYLTG